ncbi:echinoderm microtubule-associated protein-like 2 [Anguilla rostrata]|uniref:echinoderm microtubule-associated protein-like 2 n=1 Tax=Anguilla rostrata TaxID=7938 RepID=UPI0030D3CA21
MEQPNAIGTDGRAVAEAEVVVKQSTVHLCWKYFQCIPLCSHLILCFTDGAYLAVKSHDNFVYIYAVTENGRKYSRAGKCTGHSSFVTHLDWSADSQYIVTNSGDYEILFWEAASGKHLTSADTVRNLEWAASTCVLSFSVFSIWPDGADGTDINAVCRSHDAKLLVSADDFGKVRLFPNPCSQPRVRALSPNPQSHYSCASQHSYPNPQSHYSCASQHSYPNPQSHYSCDSTFIRKSTITLQLCSH